MSSPFPERRRSDRFDELLRYRANGRRQHRDTSLDAELTPLVDFTASLAATPTPPPSEDFRTGLRAMLMATIEREGIGATATDPAQRPVTHPATSLAARAGAAFRPVSEETTLVVGPAPRPAPTGSAKARLALLVGVTSGALALSGVSLASTDSVPGDALYSVKRSSEQAQLVLAGSDISRGELHLDFANSRLVEAQSVAAGAAEAVLAEMDAETRVGVILLHTAALQRRQGQLIDSVMAFVHEQRTRLNALRVSRPDASDKLLASLDLLREVETRANLVRAAVLGDCDWAESDALGPKPDC